MPKKIKKYLFILCITGSFLSCTQSNNDIASVCVVNKPADSYVFPIVPGTAQWLVLATQADRDAACQIPDATVRTMSTEALIQSWLDYPLIFGIYVTNSLPRAVAFYMTYFSGSKELCGRKDAGDKLLDRYMQMDPLCMGLQAEQNKFSYGRSFTYIEMLLAQDTMLSKMTIQRRKTLITEAIKKISPKAQYADYYNYQDILFLCGKIMQSLKYQPFLDELNKYITLQTFFIDDRMITNELSEKDIIDKVIKHAEAAAR